MPLTVEGLGVELPGFRLGDISFRVEPGAVTVFLGQNGAGKTTTLCLIMGMVRKDRGRVRIGNLDHVRDEKAFKRRIGFVPEESSTATGTPACAKSSFAPLAWRPK
jgi:ABC-2 type transport system ATP-binding protein